MTIAISDSMRLESFCNLLAKRRTLTAAATKASDPQESSGCRSRLAATGNL